jgi:vacuolar protein sorting-associated protein VTA1
VRSGSLLVSNSCNIEEFISAEALDFITMATVIPPSFKIITSALRRAEELEKESNYESKVVAYYCYFYIVSKCSKIMSFPAIPAENVFLVSQLDKLERMKPGLDLNQEKGGNICKSYALSVFEKADDEDRAGVADKGTAKLFYAAGTFFDILEQFGPISNEVGTIICYYQLPIGELVS